MLRMQLYSWSLARGSVQARGSLEIRLVFSGIAKTPAGFATCCGWKRSGQLPGSNRRTSAIAPASSMGSTQIKTSTTATQNTARQNIVGIPNYNRILFRTIQNTLELLRGTPGRNPASYDENSLGPSPFAF